MRYQAHHATVDLIPPAPGETFLFRVAPRPESFDLHHEVTLAAVTLGRLNGIGRCNPCRPPELRAFGSYSSAPADDQQLIPAWSDHGLHRHGFIDRHGSWSP